MVAQGAPEASEELLNEAVRRLVETLRPQRIYLFGSRARGDAGEESDYDLMVVTPGHEQIAIERQYEARRRLPESLSPVDLLIWPRDVFDRQVPVVASLPASILREGRLLYCDDRLHDGTNGGRPSAGGGNGGPMAAEEEKRRLTREWLEKAQQDLLMAERMNQPPVIPGGVAYHCQQAMEKALKGFLVWQDQPFQKTHALTELVQQCMAYDPAFAGLEATAEELAPYVIQFRYPGAGPAPTAALATQALRLAREAVEFVVARLLPMGGT